MRPLARDPGQRRSIFRYKEDIRFGVFCGIIINHAERRSISREAVSLVAVLIGWFWVFLSLWQKSR